MIALAVAGASGRMGRSVIRAAAGESEFTISGGLVRTGSTDLGKDLGLLAGVTETGVSATDNIKSAIEGAGVVIDFSVPNASDRVLEHCAGAGVPLVIGTTGLDENQHRAIAAAAEKTAILYAANMSVGVTLMLSLAEVASRTLADEFDIEIIDVHHRDKKDAPSGTALAIGESIDRGRGAAASREMGRGPEDGPRAPGAVGYSSVRAGDIVGEHTVLFAGNGESLELTHKATSRMTFARGALRAAHWIYGRSPGLYGMSDVIGGG
jgi:4-hydroxy-tetrahydrodipicolinate reductase